jgi:fructosamine-3-kinase
MTQDSDISWPVLRRIVREWAGESAELAEVKPLDGGCISTTLALTLADGATAVLKISAHRVDRSYEREAHQLGLLRAAGVPVPRVYACQIGSLNDPFSYLLMEFIEGVDWATARQTATAQEFDDLQSHLAEILRALHATKGRRYCRALPETEAGFDRWPDFYRAVFDPICRELEKSPFISIKERKTINRVRDKLDWFIAHDDEPRLVHWDLWSSNMLVRCNGDGRWHVTALLDPNCKFAHAEAELAYLELFQTVGPVFMKAYQRDRRLGEEYHRVRKPVYQLHSLLNHVHLFGEPYAKRLSAAVERVSALV